VKTLLEPVRDLSQDLLEFLEEVVGFALRRVAQRPDARPVDLALIEILPELHRLVEEGADGEVEENLAAHGHAGAAGSGSEQRVATLLEPEQNAGLFVREEGLQFFEAQCTPAIAGKKVANRPMGDEKVANDVHQPGVPARHRRIIPIRRQTAC
jgi:hypothetical protein